MTENKQYELFTICEAVEKLEKEKFLLPSFQRRKVWCPEQKLNLFDTIINNNLFGSFSAIKQLDNSNIFQFYRSFDKNDYSYNTSKSTALLRTQPPIYYIVDGQQRLTSLYEGLKNDGLFYNLRTNAFQLSCVDDFCYPVNTLFVDLNGSCAYEAYWVAIKERCKKSAEAFVQNEFTELSDEDKQKKIDEIIVDIKENLFKFYYCFFFFKSVSLSVLFVNNELNAERKRFMDAFVRLNTGGTNLTNEEVALCLLVGESPKFERIVKNVFEIQNIISEFPSIFLNSLILFEDLQEESDEESKSYINSSIYELVSGGKEERNISLSLKTEHLKYPEIIRRKFRYLLKNVDRIEYVLHFCARMIQELYVESKNISYILPVIITRLYYSKDSFDETKNMSEKNRLERQFERQKEVYDSAVDDLTRLEEFDSELQSKVRDAKKEYEESKFELQRFKDDVCFSRDLRSNFRKICTLESFVLNDFISIDKLSIDNFILDNE